ncbi:MAG: hypothetical protein AMXMBFR33_71820 [Candidatus Xenobia bacterium]
MAKKLNLKPIDPDLLDRLFAVPAFQPQPDSLRSVELPGRERLSVMVLPPDQLPFSTELAYWIHLRAFQDALVLMLNYFELRLGPGGWAIPYAYEPQNEFEALQQQLGFDEGWENSFPACMVVITPGDGWRAALESAARTGALGVTVTGAESVYPVRLQEWQMEELALFLAARH